MKQDVLLENLLFSVKEKLSPGANMATVLANTLFMGKEAVYRRLRGEVPFTFSEVATIAEKMSISLDNIIGTSMPNSSIFYFNQINFSFPRESDYVHYVRFVDFLRSITSEPYSEYGTSSNALPYAFTFNFEHIDKFRVFKWMYQNEKCENIVPYSELVIPDRHRKLFSEAATLYKEIKYSLHVWDCMLFSYMVKDIEYFRSIGLMNQDDVRVMKEELMAVIDQIEKIAVSGQFSTGNKVDLYVANINFETTYSYVETTSRYLSLIQVFTMNTISSYDKGVFTTLKDWIQSLKRVSILISQSGEMQRVQFIKNQREFVNSL